MGNKKIAVTVITGFLGAGKTTFINQVLKDNPEVQFALVENEFGEIAIDTKLIKGVDASKMFELREGCICCTITDEYELILQELAERFPNVEHLLIETTGIADPAPVIRPFLSDEKLIEIYRYNGTICLVDGLNFENQPEKEISLKQVAVSDALFVSKSENFSQNQKNEFEDQLRRINPLADVSYFKRGKPVDFSLNGIVIRNVLPEKHEHNHQSIDTKKLVFQAPLDKDDFVSRFSYMLDINKQKIYRAKGFLHFSNEPFAYILQGVGGSFELTESESFSAGQQSEIVLIGKLTDADLTL